MYNKKLPHSAPKVEDLVLGELYAISLNPIEEWKAGQLPIAWVKKQYTLLKELVRGCELQLYPESSPTGRLHFHGYILIKDTLEYLMTLKGLSCYGTYCIKPITDGGLVQGGDTEASHLGVDEGDVPQTWQQYCTKQAFIFEPLFKNSIMSYPMTLTEPIRLNTVD